jgi:hypothetical protein
MLLDGGFEYNCPVACAYSEGKSIWSDRSCDILLSLGTGVARAKHPLPALSQHRFRRVAQAVVRRITDANVAWHAFYGSGREEKIILKRLNPEYQETGFALDEFQNVDEIETQAKRWIETQNKELDDICDRLIAALFFFRPLSGTKGDAQDGEILCRLPVDIMARDNLVKRMLQMQQYGLNLFEVDYGRVHAHTIEVVKDLCLNEELRLHVKLPDLSATARRTQIHVKMRRLVSNSQDSWLPISGSPLERFGRSIY